MIWNGPEMTKAETLPEQVRTSFDAVLARASAVGISRSRLCRKADVHETTVARVLNGQTRRPDPETVNRLKEALTAMLKEKEQ